MRSITATFLTWVMFASAQQPVPQSQQTPGEATAGKKTTATFSTSLQLVVENVVLKDKSGTVTSQANQPRKFQLNARITF